MIRSDAVAVEVGRLRKERHADCGYRRGRKERGAGTEDARWSALARMVARVWRGYTTRANGDAYEAMLKSELLPGLSSAKGFRGSYLLRRPADEQVEFVTIILWDSLDDIPAIAGADYERAVIPEERRSLLTRCDEKAAHYDIRSSKAGPLSFL